ncbi:MAG: TerB family tellurite resistance protein [Stellaceae bacterium]
MFQALHRLLAGFDDAPDAAGQNDTAFALAVLLIQVACTDDRFDDAEESVIERMLARRFDLTRHEIVALLDAAKERALQATDLFHFTRVVVDEMGETERIGVVEMLWEVAEADGECTGDEDSLIRRVAGLIYVSDHDRGEARRRVRGRLSG